jgi:hypothetical protein
MMSQAGRKNLETDPRFPSGPWTGFFLQREVPGRHMMELHLTFSEGELTGEGRDWVGAFIMRGKYSVMDGKCHWTKRYVGKHDVFYQGFNEGKGIWGRWEMTMFAGAMNLHGGFHIWPEGMADPTQQHLTESAELPTPMVEPNESKELVGEPAG